MNSGLSRTFASEGFFIISYILVASGGVAPAPAPPPMLPIIYYAILIISGLFIISFTIGLFIISAMFDISGIPPFIWGNYPGY
jgi:hypothetical protein